MDVGWCGHLRPNCWAKLPIVSSRDILVYGIATLQRCRRRAANLLKPSRSHFAKLFHYRLAVPRDALKLEAKRRRGCGSDHPTVWILRLLFKFSPPSSSRKIDIRSPEQADTSRWDNTPLSVRVLFSKGNWHGPQWTCHVCVRARHGKTLDLLNPRGSRLIISGPSNQEPRKTPK